MEEKKASFIDAKGQEWPFVINLYHARKIKNEIGIDLLKILTDAKSKKILEDPYELLGVFYVLSDAEKKGVGEEDFLRVLDGPAIDAAARAFRQALINFFPTPKAQALQPLIDKQEEIENQETELLKKRVMEKVQAMGSGNLCSDPPELLE